MSDVTKNLGLPLIAGSQAQKHVTHNEALTLLDALVQLACLDKDLAAPPASPAEGDRYLVAAANPTGAWTGFSGQVAVLRDGVWVGLSPRPGWFAFVADEAELYLFTGAIWVSYRSALVTALQTLPRLGVNTAADAANRLAVKADAALFSWDDVTPGSGSMRVALNKRLAASDAGLTFQTGFSARALFGTLGSDDVTLKVSPDGASFTTVLKASAATGRLTLGRIDAAATIEVSANAGTLPPPRAGSVLRVSGADGTSPLFVIDSFGGSSGGSVAYRAAQGTAAAPAALQAGNVIGQFNAFGYGATAYSANSRAKISLSAVETWTDTAQGTRISFQTTAQGTAAASEALAVEANGAISLAPRSGDPAGGAALGQIYVNSTATALKWYNGNAWVRINSFAKFSAYAGADTYAAAGTWTKVAFNNADSNDQGAFVAGSSRFVAPEAGLYGFSVALVFKRNGASAPTAFEVQFYRNGAAAGRGRAAATGTLVDGVTAIDLSSALKLAAGDAVEVYARLTGADGYAAAADSVFCGQQMA